MFGRRRNYCPIGCQPHFSTNCATWNLCFRHLILLITDTEGHYPHFTAVWRTVTAAILIKNNLMVSIRDGVQRATDVYRLDREAPAPVLLTRTRYNKEYTRTGASIFDILRAVQAGYAVVVQDVRGWFASEGSFNPHFQESHGGANTIAWVATHPSCRILPIIERWRHHLA